jgi:enamine deaminase RidA (YjgF/YER057c/UK114 family)
MNLATAAKRRRCRQTTSGNRLRSCDYRGYAARRSWEADVSETIQARLKRLGIVLPAAAAPAANYKPFIRHGGLLYVSGQLPITDGAPRRGKLGHEVDVSAGKDAARLCAVHVLAQANAALDSSPDFSEHHLVVNGASELLVDVLGERGRHARAAVGVAALPLDACVEVDAILAVG